MLRHLISETTPEELRISYLKHLMNDEALTKAAELGLDVVYPDEYTITLDFDSPIPPAQYYKMLPMIQQHYDITRNKITESKSGNCHVYLKTDKPFTPLEQVALQAILGSDPARELFSFIRAKEQLGGWASLMFEKPGNATPAAFVDVSDEDIF